MNRRITTGLLAALVATLAALPPSAAGAQPQGRGPRADGPRAGAPEGRRPDVGPGARGEQMREQRRGAMRPDGTQPRPGMDPARRQMMERQLRERFGEVVRRQLALDDRQFQRLREHNREFEGRRRSLMERERSARMIIREELARGDGADDARVGEQMQEILRLQRDRATLAEDEDAKLGEFLSPAQRAKYFGLQDQLRRRVDEMRRRAMLGDGPMGPPAGGPPPIEPEFAPDVAPAR